MTRLEFVEAVYVFGPAYAANVSPIFAARLCPALDAPLDGGRTFRGRPLLGAHKTRRGLLACAAAGVTMWEGQRLLDHLGFCHNLALVDYAAEPLVPVSSWGSAPGSTTRSSPFSSAS